MAYDEDLAYRIRELVAAERGVEEKRMFGGLAFLINGNMSVAASGRRTRTVLLASDTERGTSAECRAGGARCRPRRRAPSAGAARSENPPSAEVPTSAPRRTW